MNNEYAIQVDDIPPESEGPPEGSKEHKKEADRKEADRKKAASKK